MRNAGVLSCNAACFVWLVTSELVGGKMSPSSSRSVGIITGATATSRGVSVWGNASDCAVGMGVGRASLAAGGRGDLPCSGENR